MAQVSCPTCQRTLTLADELLGRKIKCPACQLVIQTSAQGAADVLTAERLEDPAEEETKPDRKAAKRRKKKGSGKGIKSFTDTSKLMMFLPPLITAAVCMSLALFAGFMSSNFNPACIVLAPMLAAWGCFLILAATYEWEWLGDTAFVILQVILVGWRFDPTMYMLRGVVTVLLAFFIAVAPWIFASKAASKQNTPPQEAASPEDFLAQVTAGMASSEPFRRNQTFSMLADMSREKIQTYPENVRLRIALQLQENMRNQLENIRHCSIRGFAKWAPPQMAFVNLIDLLDQNDKATRRLVILTLGDFPERAVIQALAPLLDSDDRAAAAKALGDIGPAAEEEVLRLLRRPDTRTHDYVCLTLRSVGTEKSLPLLERDAKSNDRLISEPAKEAMAAIRKRLGKE